MPSDKQKPSARELWSAPQPVADIPETGLHRELVADAQTRAQVAAGTGLRDVSKLTARFDLVPGAGEKIHVTGHVSAVVGQTCVVTLEPLDSTIEERIDVTFAPGVEEPEPAPESDDPNRHGSWEVDPPEPIENGAIDLGALATEFMILGINPYPRKEGVTFDTPAQAADPETHPFAALARLKGKDSSSRN
jgi:hypothetical protein